MFDAFETEREFCVVTEYAQVIQKRRTDYINLSKIHNRKHNKER